MAASYPKKMAYALVAILTADHRVASTYNCCATFDHAPAHPTLGTSVLDQP